jgi:hypothetical protein
MTQHKNEEPKSANEDLPALPLAVETLKLAYSDFHDTIESIHTRAGVGLTLTVAVFAFVGSKIQTEQVAMFETLWWLAVIVYIFALGLLGYGGYCFLQAFRPKKVIAAYSTKELHEKEYLKTAQEFHLQELSNFKQAIEAREVLAGKKSKSFNFGLTYTIWGLIIFFTVQLLGSLVVLNRTPITQKNTIPTVSSNQTEGGSMSNPKPSNNQSKPEPSPKPSPPPPTVQPNNQRIEIPVRKIGAEK